MKKTAPLSLIILLLSCNGNKKSEIDSRIEVTDFFKKSTEGLFQPIGPEKTRIDFYNSFTETHEHNMFSFVYNNQGAGVGVGDFNNDGLKDLVFAGNEVTDRVYINKGNLQFEDITKSAGLYDTTTFSTGVTIVDINADGYDDIYICRAGHMPEDLRDNKLYINNRDLTFTEAAASYNLNSTDYSSMANFFDYDNDGDLDMYLLNFPPTFNGLALLKDYTKIERGENSSDKLYKNNGNGQFEEVSRQAGINNHGHGLSVSVADINNDGWQDIYVTNDFIISDYLYINNQDGTFSFELNRTGKNSKYAMGSDFSDINDDGLLDLITVDVDYKEPIKRRTFRASATSSNFEAQEKSGYHIQYPRNMLQMNSGNGTFSESAFLLGVIGSEWSWSPLFFDFDNDGRKDLFISNGFVLDWSLDNRDNHRQLRQAARKKDKERYWELRVYSEDKTNINPNLFYHNEGAQFKTVLNEGCEVPTISQGAAYADFDNDGDQDLVVNNINSVSFLYENKLNEQTESNFLSVELVESSANPKSLGSFVYVYSEGKFQMKFSSIVRGYLSCSDNRMHFGLGNKPIDSVVVKWNDGQWSTLQNVEPNQFLKVHKDSIELKEGSGPEKENLLLNASLAGIDYVHKENEYPDFNAEHLIMYKLSDGGPGLAVGDLNHDGLDDVVIGGSAGSGIGAYFQQPGGNFTKASFLKDESREYCTPFIADMNLDGRNDLLLLSGGCEAEEQNTYYANTVYLNNGKGGYEMQQNLLPEGNVSNSCIIKANINQDAYPEYFVGSRLKPNAYPLSEPSQLLIYSNGKYRNVIDSLIPEFKHGMVTSAVWTDFNNDNRKDLIVVGEWMDIDFYVQNSSGIFEHANATTGLGPQVGWWNSINGGDFDRDGDIDYVVGNFGLNTRFTPNEEGPIQIMYGSLKEDGSHGYIISYMDQGKRYPIHTLGWLREYYTHLQFKYSTFEELAQKSLDELLGAEKVENASIISANNLSSIYLENLGEGRFKIKALPQAAQVSLTKGSAFIDINGDDNLDLVLQGNHYGMAPNYNRQDGGKGLVLLGDGDGGFEPVPSWKSGFEVDMDARSLALMERGGAVFTLSSANNDSLKVHEVKGDYFKLPEQADYCITTYKDGSIRKTENYSGTSFLSQYPSFVMWTKDIEKIEVYYVGGKSNTVFPPT